jgi:hypothetical protein
MASILKYLVSTSIAVLQASICFSGEREDILMKNLLNSINLNNPYTFYYHLNSKDQDSTKLSKDHYLALLKAVAKYDVAPCYLSKVLERVNADYPGLEVDQYFSIDQPGLTPIRKKGIEKMVEYQRLHGELPDHIATRFATTMKELAGEVSDFMEKAPPASEGIFFRNDFVVEDDEAGGAVMQFETLHWSHVFLRRDDLSSVCQAYFFDAARTTDYLEELKATVERAGCKLFYSSTDFTPNGEATSCSPRQSDNHSCGIFALSDLRFASKAIIKNRLAHEGESCATVSSLDFIMSSQSIKKLNQFILDNDLGSNSQEKLKKKGLKLLSLPRTGEVPLDHKKAELRHLTDDVSKIGKIDEEATHGCTTKENGIYFNSDSKPTEFNMTVKDIRDKYVLEIMKDLFEK